MKAFGVELPRRRGTGAAQDQGDRPRLSHRKRRVAAAAAIGTAVIILAWVLVPTTDDGVDVLVAAKDIPAGAKIAAGDLQIRSFPERLAPRKHFDSPTAVTGKTAAHQIAVALPLTPDVIMTPGSAKLPDGNVLVPVSLPDTAVAAVLETGHRVRVYSAAGESARSDDKLDDNLHSDSQVLVSNAVITAIRKPDSGGLTGEASTVVTLSVPENRAAKLAATAAGGLGFALLN